ncbi:hypothetical protein [Bradyrhizobium sp. CER78]|uniref:hypothetical protein n=1 Tax=Bradyrhizobium sp. CER78 TaxID=3039162 RepID=UPI00244B6A66|nr:hypothetical protein [Bradyrhizobium sp. CER78]MDH2384361.1 hypothetical protein [Bradyrhizobium sp. CER78]
MPVTQRIFVSGFPRHLAPDLGVFVLETEGARRLAFEAGSREDAEAMTRANWFALALGSFCSRRRRVENAESRLRVATDPEITIFRQWAAEFAGEAADVFVACLD